MAARGAAPNEPDQRLRQFPYNSKLSFRACLDPPAMYASCHDFHQFRLGAQP